MTDLFLTHQDALAGLDPAFIKENPEFVEAYGNINLKDIGALNTVLKSVDQLLKKYATPNDKIKNTVEIIFRQILSRYPLLFGYWKRFTAIEYQFHGLETSLKTLENATESFPHSVDLWCDYLKVLIVNYPKESELIKRKIDKAKELVGWQFYSHPFWDLILDYYLKTETDVIQLYHELISIPLHQYAKYITAFKKLLTERKLTEDIKKVDAMGKQNQIMVNQIWRFESLIKQNYFNLTPLPPSEVENWINYTQFLTKTYCDKPQLIRSVFQRSLIPCCFVEKIWVRYLTWNQSIDTTKDLSKLDDLIQLYEKGCRTLPKTTHEFRWMFIDRLEKSYASNEKAGKVLIFTSFCKCIKNMIEIWPYRQDQIKSMETYLRMLKISKYYSSLDTPSKQLISQQTTYSKYLETCINNFISDRVDHSIVLEDLINERNLAVVVVELIRTTWLVLKKTLQTRKYFNHFSKHPSLRTSVDFWAIYYNFEKSTKNFVRLNSFVSGLGTDLLLPTSFINDIINDYKIFYLLNSNITEYQTGKIGPTSSHNSESAVILDPILEIGFKINNPKWTRKISNNGRINKIDAYKNSQYKENGHPGIVSDTPQITNSIIQRRSKSFKNILPGLPTFRNLEKINQIGNYRDYYSEDILNSKQ
ncbi:similar to Saccharomyces cerevisiae YML046W PRP39 U1 snRNP protein involved in splicing, contains multiple tetriatricopeptide repeats [Maudiozyma barnettii]|uniref:Similar to Saccharomyces cerevisiae YML046W PRP39 U1 snRNP protein involved in splicing, contains multiple tetriatricopeptide repeats n=1 Tax=Maudiozyma barnettii TaxID=61262 RepID=A0A8H2VFQ0_9SACH|nr:Prp39p [Kazachstania barnettii]CAB4254720.1 similar to Saccharomyces cerevisiae YML046W PRP39 U1 snRNP protein involved in splicing, contains multiple tetriatricopeptide repeats [Kazachstania barnettii]CAD1782762.1 similar to Saccharomyces cerevisiae YML046W PRP39 U1 snRNP protein involved in splicing, contains multiple tetriatricopeptide repeats [Kazachstania barnettii]